MKISAKSAVVGIALALVSQPCLAETIESQSTVAVPMASTVERVEFNLHSYVQAAGQKDASRLELASAVSANAAIVAQETEERERRGMSKGTKTALIVGGVVVVGVIALAIIAASSTPPSIDW